MNCSKCRRSASFLDLPKDDNVMVVFDLNHAVMEEHMLYCPDCKKPFCGQCCLPKWQALKAAKKLSGRELAAKLEADPDACFMEHPSCPACGKILPLEPPEGVRSSCFIATAACGSAQAEDVARLRAFRDAALAATLPGRAFIRLYEAVSPPLAGLIARSEAARGWTRRLVVRPARRLADRWLESGRP